MKTILLTNKYEATPLKILKEAIGDDFNLMMLDEVSQDNLREKISDADYLLVSGRLKVGKEELDKATRLKMIQRTGVGLDSMDLDYMKKINVPLYVNKGVNAVSVAEHALMMLLACLRRTVSVDNQIRKGVWKKQETGLSTHELFGKKVGVIGMGNIGKAFVKLLMGFNVDIAYYDQYRLTKEEEEQLNLSYVELNELLKNSDIVSLHCSYNGQYVLDETQLKLMKEDSILINTSRGKLINQSALVSELKKGKFMGVGVDVFEEEPINCDNPLFKYDRVVMSPHIGGVTYEAFYRMMKGAVDNMRLFEKGKLEELEACKMI